MSQQAQERPRTCDARARRGAALGVVMVVLVLSLGLLVWQHWWESQAALIIPDHHQVLFLSHAASTHHWIQARLGWEDPTELQNHFPGILAPEALGLFPNTDDYPPLTFLLAGLAMSLLGKSLAVARLSQWVLAAGSLVCMARIGWQLAGPRGACLLATGAAFSPWLIYHLFNFSMVPGEVLALALTLTLLLDSRGLTRRGVCVALGGVLGLGMLVKYSFLIFSLPMVAAAAFWGSRLSRGTWRGWVAVAAAFFILSLLILEIGPLFRPGNAVGNLWLVQVGTLRAEALFAMLLLVGLRLGRGRWNAGAGLVLAVAEAGLLCAPWYMSHLEQMLVLTGLQWSVSPVSREILADSLSFWSYLRILSTFFSLGLWWLLIGLVLPQVWCGRGARYGVVVAGLLGSAVLYWILLVPTVRYLAPMLPLAATVAFLWASRWRWTFLGCLAFQLLVGFWQLPQVPPRDLGVDVRFGLEDPDNWHADDTPLDFIVWRVQEPRASHAALSPLRVLPRGATVALSLPQGEERLRTFFALYLWGRNPVVEPGRAGQAEFILTRPGDLATAPGLRVEAVTGTDALIRVGQEVEIIRLYRVAHLPPGD